MEKYLLKQNNIMLCFVRCRLNANYKDRVPWSFQELFTSEVWSILCVIYKFPAITAIHT